jgi:hypothetical protein
LILGATAAVLFVLTLDIPIVDVALPAICAALGFAPVDLARFLHGYALMFSADSCSRRVGLRPVRWASWQAGCYPRRAGGRRVMLVNLPVVAVTLVPVAVGVSAGEPHVRAGAAGLVGRPWRPDPRERRGRQ